MISQKRVWELMSKECKHGFVKSETTDFCAYYGAGELTLRYCKCETCPILGLAAHEIYKQ